MPAANPVPRRPTKLTQLRKARSASLHRLRRSPAPVKGGKLTESTPKTRAGERRVYLGPETARLLAAHRETQDLERMLAGAAWQDDDLVFCHDDGSPWRR